MLDRVTALDLLTTGTIEVVGRITGSSNNARFVRVVRPHPTDRDGPNQVLEAIYKPTAGERPLGDFPDRTLSRREVAAWLVSEAIGWDIVPPTILRDGPFGAGMLQAFVAADPTVDVVDLIVRDDPRLRRMAAFDAAINNTDRKGGHILPIAGGAHLHGVDHGLTFSVVPKLRTVLWGWRGRPFLPDELAGLERLRDALCEPGAWRDQLGELLSTAELQATQRRVDALLTSGRFPYPTGDWPAVPWPPF
jgi:uncharacterized repeat protein (TIGR03843 family)